MGKEIAMSIKFRHYNDLDDYKRIDAFFIEHYQPETTNRNWIEPARVAGQFYWIAEAGRG